MIQGNNLYAPRQTQHHKGSLVRIKQWLAVCAAGGLIMASSPVVAQERTLDEVKKEVARRAARINPFEGILREDAEAMKAKLEKEGATVDLK